MIKSLKGKRIEDLPSLFDDVGRASLEKSFSDLELASAQAISESVSALRTTRESFAVGLVHGDLHAQNVLVSERQDLHLIDFAWAGYNWKAVDFLMMECSLKFIVAPRDARVEDLIEMERRIEGHEEKMASDFEPLGQLIHGQGLQIFASAINTVRHQAKHCQAIKDFAQYRRGLILLSACLATYPEFNRSFLAHSLAFHVAHLA